jgi:hypothetical protein
MPRCIVQPALWVSRTGREQTSFGIRSRRITESIARLAFSPRSTGATTPRRTRRDVAQRSSVCSRRMSRPVDSLCSGFQNWKRATTLRAGLIPDSLVKGMRPECRPPSATHCGGRAPFAWKACIDSIIRRQGNSVADRTLERLLSVLRSKIKTPRSPDDPESAWSAFSLLRGDVIPNDEGTALAPAPATMLTATIPDGAAMIGGERSQDSPLSKPKSAERYALLHLQTVRARGRLALSSPRAFDQT